jgi:hypothetical protein
MPMHGSRSIEYAVSSAVFAVLGACSSSSDAPATHLMGDGGAAGSPSSAEAGEADAVAEADAGAGAEAAPEAAAEASSPDAGWTTQSLVRIADLTPDAPAVGFDVCLAPTGTKSWVGPLLDQSFPPGALGEGGPNGVQFATVSAYFPVPPGRYDLQLVKAGGSCAVGVIPMTVGLPPLVAGQYTTFATVGDVNPTSDDASLKVSVLSDDHEAAPGAAALRVVNALPSVAYIDVGKGSLARGDFAPILVDVAFAAATAQLPDGGATDTNGYAQIAPTSGVLLSAHPSGATSGDTAMATNVSLVAGSVTTLALINGMNGGRPPQFFLCTDNAPPSGTQTPCRVYVQ